MSLFCTTGGCRWAVQWFLGLYDSVSLQRQKTWCVDGCGHQHNTKTLTQDTGKHHGTHIKEHGGIITKHGMLCNKIKPTSTQEVAGETDTGSRQTEVLHRLA